MKGGKVDWIRWIFENETQVYIYALLKPIFVAGLTTLLLMNIVVKKSQNTFIFL